MQTPLNPNLGFSYVDSRVWVYLDAANGGAFGGPNIIGNLTFSPIPSGDTQGGLPLPKYHVTVAPAGGAGTYTFLHGLQWTPTTVWLMVETAQGVTPTIYAAWDVTDTTSTLIAFNVSGNCTVDVMYG